MRLKKVKNARDKISNSDICFEINEITDVNKLFDNDNEVHIEIGIGKGQFIYTLAKENPNINYIGVEMFDSVIVRALEKQEIFNLSNIKFIRADAKMLREKFNDYFTHIYLNFSDPWPKNRHEKRRLTSKEFLAVYKQITKRNGLLTFKTDNSDLYMYSLTSMFDFGCKICKLSDNLHNSRYAKNNIKTEYEEKFSEKGFAIKMVEVCFM